MRHCETLGSRIAIAMVCFGVLGVLWLPVLYPDLQPIYIFTRRHMWVLGLSTSACVLWAMIVRDAVAIEISLLAVLSVVFHSVFT